VLGCRLVVVPSNHGLFHNACEGHVSAKGEEPHLEAVIDSKCLDKTMRHTLVSASVCLVGFEMCMLRSAYVKSCCLPNQAYPCAMLIHSHNFAMLAQVQVSSQIEN
jgi:hypothetical protein